MKITALAENVSTTEDLGSEHGLSLFIETEAHKLLFDTGQGSLFAENAVKLGVDLKQVERCVISHGHYDHTGGLYPFLSINSKAKVYIKKEAFISKYKGEIK